MMRRHGDMTAPAASSGAASELRKEDFEEAVRLACGQALGVPFSVRSICVLALGFQRIGDEVPSLGLRARVTRGQLQGLLAGVARLERVTFL